MTSDCAPFPDCRVGMFGHMSFLRFLSRAAFASAFIVDGIGKVTKPAESAPEAEAFTERVAPLIQRVVPAEYSSHVPDKAETWVRLGGAAQIVGGAMFATGIGRRLGALLLAKASILNTAIALPAKGASAAEKSLARPAVLSNIALLGASVLATQDLQGRPSLSWRAGHAADKAEKKVSATTEQLSKKAGKAAKRAEKHAQRLAKQARREAKALGHKLESVIN